VLLRQELDELFAAFCETLPQRLRAGARELPYRLQMAISPSVPWSEVLGHEVTFAAPALFAEAMPHIAPGKVRDAVLAHALAVIEAFGTDRIEDRQVERSDDLVEILARVRSARDRALLMVVGETSGSATDFGRVHEEMLRAIRAERALMVERAPVGFDIYEKIAVGKTAIGTPASVALARAAGWNPSECSAVAATLESVWLGMQYHDDVIDWEDDFRRDSAWTVLLARGTKGPSTEAEGLAPLGGARLAVLDSGVLAKMLERSFRHFRAARRRADALGARELASWAKTKEEHALGLARNEEANSGYAVRLHALSPWVAQVLS